MPQPQHYRQRLTGRIAIVTGAGSQGSDELGVGTGKAIAIVFAGEGARVCLVDREPERAERTRQLIAAAGGEAFVSAADVTLDADCRRVVAETTARFGAPHILVNNVGIAAGGGLTDFDETTWQRVMDVNLKSAILMSRYVVGPMAAQGGGAIVNIASIAGIRRYGALAYGPSKAAMIALTGEMAVLHGRDRIRANSIAPGHVFTPMSMGLLGDEARAERRKAGPLGIEGDAWDVAAAALFLASDEARFITGVCIPVDGGVVETGSLVAHAMINSKS